MRKRTLKRIKRRIRRPFEWLGIALGYVVFSTLPRRAMLAACDFAAAAMHFFDAKGRRLALENLRVVTGKTDRGAAPADRREALVIRRSYRNMARAAGHAFWTCRKARARVEEAGEMGEAAKEFLAANRPAVTVSGHIGCWEILSQLAFLEGHRMTSVAKDIGSPGMTKLLMRARQSIGQEIIHAEGAFRPLLKGLKEGKSLGLLVDQAVRPKDGGVWVRFFGRPMPVSAAPAFFSAKGGAPMIVAWSRPLKDGRYRCEALAVHGAEESRDVWAMTQKCVRHLEKVIRRHPSCWVLNYRYFRMKPSGEELRQLEEREAELGGAR